jgi:uncharacterized membrane protein YfcA
MEVAVSGCAMLTINLDPASLGLLFVASVVAGGVNAIAGGGTILTFAVLSAILPPGPGRLVTANVTSKIGLWPGAAAAAWASRRSWAGLPKWARWLVLPSAAGAVAGVALLRYLPRESFDAVVPWLILLAAVLFAIQPQLSRTLAGDPRATAGQSAGLSPTLFGLQLLVGIYGGYFGAGIGILMLASLALVRLGDMHALNAVKNLLAATVNGVATLVLVVAALSGGFEVSWLHVAVLAAGSVVGGAAVAAVTPRLPARAVRRLVAIIAFALAGYHFWREWAG